MKVRMSRSSLHIAVMLITTGLLLAAQSIAAFAKLEVLTNILIVTTIASGALTMTLVIANFIPDT